MRWLVAVAAGRNGSGTARITFNMAERAAVPSPRSSCAPPVVSTLCSKNPSARASSRVSPLTSVR